MAIEEISKRVLEYKNMQYETLPLEGNEAVEQQVIKDYTGNPDNITT